MTARRPVILLLLLARFGVSQTAERHDAAGVASAESGRRDAAIAEFREAVRLDPGVAQAQLDVANAVDALWHRQRDLSSVKYPKIEDYQNALSDAQDRLTIAQTNNTINDVGSLGVSIQAAQDAVKNAQDRLGEAQSAENGCGGCDPDRLNKAQDNLNGALNNLQALQLQQEQAQA